MANQILIGIPLSKALDTFSKDVGNKKISRSITLIGQAEKAGGDISEILEKVTESVSVSDRLKKERKASIQTLIVQGYIIFIVFILIVLLLQFKIVPMLSNISGLGGSMGALSGGTQLSTGTSGGDLNQNTIASSFLYLLMVQGLFCGLVIGKLSEGNIKSGIKHSIALMVLSFVISTIGNLLFAQ